MAPNHPVNPDARASAVHRAGPAARAGYWERWRGRFAPRHRAADYHTLSDRRFAPAIKRMQPPAVLASTLASRPVSSRLC